MRARRLARASVWTLPNTTRPSQSSCSAFTTEVASPVTLAMAPRFCSISSSVCCSTRTRASRVSSTSSPM